MACPCFSGVLLSSRLGWTCSYGSNSRGFKNKHGSMGVRHLEAQTQNSVWLLLYPTGQSKPSFKEWKRRLHLLIRGIAKNCGHLYNRPHFLYKNLSCSWLLSFFILVAVVVVSFLNTSPCVQFLIFCLTLWFYLQFILACAVRQLFNTLPCKNGCISEFQIIYWNF